MTRARLSRVQASFLGAGYIAYTWGRLTLIDRAAIEEQSCDCYRIIRDAMAAL